MFKLSRFNVIGFLTISLLAHFPQIRAYSKARGESFSILKYFTFQDRKTMRNTRKISRKEQFWTLPTILLHITSLAVLFWGVNRE